jgi:RimJ/RimL family protein N-acetyltransferase
VHLRDVRLSDIGAYVQMRCDPAMMAHLGGPRRREDMGAKVARDVADVEAGRALICMIIADEEGAESVAGTVTLWTRQVDGTAASEIGWMVLRAHQGRGLAKQAVRSLLQRAQAEGTWGTVHAFPSVDNAPSNGICRSIGFRLLGVEEITYAGQLFRSHHWWIDPAAGTRE